MDAKGMIAMRAFRRRLTAVSVAIVGVASFGLLATGCSSARTPAAAKTITVTPPPAAKTVAATAAATPPGPGPCPANQLRLSVGRPDGAAGTIYYPLDFTNVSSAACTMYGYPGVAFVTSQGGSVIGAPAGRRTIGGLVPTLITLQPGATARATLAISDVLLSDQCHNHQLPVSTIQVYPPDQYTALFAPFSRTGCADKSLVVMWVSPVTLGS
jgi:Protein of unknown function (DUF4232)